MGFKSDIEIAQECEMLPITEIAEKAGIDDTFESHNCLLSVGAASLFS